MLCYLKVRVFAVVYEVFRNTTKFALD